MTALKREGQFIRRKKAWLGVQFVKKVKVSHNRPRWPKGFRIG
jgi:hypothetical protein